MKTKSFGFTLAEVLITLGIIGVVAAMTMPTLIQNHRKSVVETRLAKVYSVMNQAINMSKIENGEFETWEFTDASDSIEVKKAWLNKYILKYLKGAEIDETDDYIDIKLPDGTLMRTSVHASLRDYGVIIFNKLYNFRFSPVAVAPNDYNKYHLGKGFEPYAYAWDGNVEHLYTGHFNKYSCDDMGVYCAKLIQYNGWKIPKDYPVKF